MNALARPIKILVADDDPDDQLLIKDALDDNRHANVVDFVGDGVELMDYLNRRGDYAHLAGQPLPGLILLDLNMPRKDGREAIAEIKADPVLRRTPIVVLTTSTADADIFRTYDLGASSYISKPVTFAGLIEAMDKMTDYWAQIATLPGSVR